MSNVRSLDDLKQDSDDDDGKHNELYTGGTRSGQVVRGPPRKEERDDDDDDDEDHVSDLFAKARRHGAADGTSADLEGPKNAFRGTANTLSSSAAAPPPAAAADAGPCIVKFYKNRMFTVGNGPGRSVDDPAEQSFIQSIGRGECPDELEPAIIGAEVKVNLVRTDEDYKEAEKPKYTAFKGAGRSLTAEASTSGSTSATAAAVAAAKGSAGEWQGIDAAKPSTSLQLRLADGSRMVAQFNHDHTIADVRRFLRASKPEQRAPYQLMTAFPSKLVENETATLEAAGLINAVLIQKLC